MGPDGSSGPYITRLEVEDEPPQQQEEPDNTPITRKRGRDDNDSDDDVSVPLSQVRRLLEESTRKQEQMLKDFLAKMSAKLDEEHRMYVDKLVELEDRRDREWEELMKRQERSHERHMDELERAISALEKCCQHGGMAIPPHKDVSDRRDQAPSNNDKQ